ncbi:MAG: hypothetical protein R2912_07015 [Eubacteriales bacterium]
MAQDRRGEIIATPGCESNVKEIFDKTWEPRETRDDVVIFNQFEEMGNCVQVIIRSLVKPSKTMKNKLR